MSTDNAMVEGATEAYEARFCERNLSHEDIHNTIIDADSPDSGAFIDAINDNISIVRAMYKLLHDTTTGKDLRDKVREYM